MWSEDIIIDEGFFLEFYGNPYGKYDEDSSDGVSYFLFIDQDITYGKLLDIFIELGSVKDDTLTIRTVAAWEEQERGFCLENKISQLI